MPPAFESDATTSMVSTTIGSATIFQSSPGPKAGCNASCSNVGVEPAWFQSSPGPKAGCNPAAIVTVCVNPEFQSSPGPKAGCNFLLFLRGVKPYTFQSSPGPKAGCNFHIGVLISMIFCFNPHPARKPDATVQALIEQGVGDTTVTLRKQGIFPGIFPGNLREPKAI